MISIIISSYKPDLFKQFAKNVADTIGVSYEIIRIDNPGLMGICEAYNTGALQAKYNILCFCHEDILFHTPNWGLIVVGFLKDKKNALLGVCGTKAFAKAPAPWWEQGVDNRYQYLYQHVGDEVVFRKEGWKEDDMGFKEVVAIDGLFMISKMSNNFQFDEELLGYHAYDLDISFGTLKRGGSVYVTNLFQIEHLSNGNLDKSWYRTMSRFIIKNKSVLPFKTEEGILHDKNKLYINFINGCLDQGLRNIAFRNWLSLFLINPFLYYHRVFLKRFLGEINR